MAQSSAAEQVVEHSQKRAVRPIDLVHLAKQCLGDEHLESEVLRLFDTTMESYQARLETSGSADDLAMCLHSIKGAASGVGAFAVADLARDAEAELQARRSLQPEHMSDLSMAIEEVRLFIARMLSNQPA